MNLQEFEKISVDQFMGLYTRGLQDECPADHSPDCQNIIFHKNGEISTRGGIAKSLQLAHPVTRMFLATFLNAGHLLTTDGAGSIYSGTSGVPLITVPGMTDFTALNMFNKCFISPITGGPAANVMVWNGTSAPRDAAGLPPVSACVAADGGVGTVSIGVHQIRVVFITGTGFKTPPGPAVAYTAPGLKSINLSSIPIGPAHVVARQIIVTRGNEEEFFFVGGGLISDNTTTTLTGLDFTDASLVVSADYLFDLLTVIPAGIGSSGLAKYHGRLLSWGSENDLVRVSLPGDPESMDSVTGYIQLPSENDGNIVRGSCQIGDVLYFTKSVGILSTQDTGDTPSNWPITQVDGGVGSYYYGISSITGSQPSLSMSNLFMLADRSGLFLFNGVVQRPELTWKIRDTWERTTHGMEGAITAAVDPFTKMIYVCLPVDGSLVGNLLIAGDFSDGIVADRIKWTIYTFPVTVRTISMINFSDQDSLADFDYYLRLGVNNNNLYKLRPLSTNDDGSAINGYYKCALLPDAGGGLSVFRFLRTRSTGSGTLLIQLSGEDGSTVVNPPSLTLSATPGKELDRQINYEAEKMAVRLSTNGVTDRMTVERLDIYAKSHFAARPG